MDAERSAPWSSTHLSSDQVARPSRIRWRRRQSKRHHSCSLSTRQPPRSSRGLFIFAYALSDACGVLRRDEVASVSLRALWRRGVRRSCLCSLPRVIAWSDVTSSASIFLANSHAVHDHLATEARLRNWQLPRSLWREADDDGDPVGERSGTSGHVRSEAP